MRIRTLCAGGVALAILALGLGLGRQPRARGTPVEPITVFAAGSLVDALENLAGEWDRTADVRVYLNLASSPRILLLDEPLASLDGVAKLRIMTYLMRIYEKWQVPFIFVSHSLTEILFVTEMSWRISGGRIARAVHPQELLTASFDGTDDPILNILRGTVAEVPAHTGLAVVSCGGQRLKVPDDGLRARDEVILALRARDVILSLAPPRGLSARNVLSARIRHLSQNGRVLLAFVEGGTNWLVVELTEDAGRELALRRGMPVYLVFKTHSATVTAAKGRPNNEG